MGEENEFKIHEKVKAIIKDNGLKQRAIAARTHWNEKQFNYLLSGEKKFYADYLPEICKALGMTPNEVFDYVPKGMVQ